MLAFLKQVCSETNRPLEAGFCRGRSTLRVSGCAGESNFGRPLAQPGLPGGLEKSLELCGRSGRQFGERKIKL